MNRECILVGEHEIVLARSARRRTTSLEIVNGEVKLRCPQRASLRSLTQFALSKEQWLNKHSQFIGALPKAIHAEDGVLLKVLDTPYQVDYNFTKSGPAIIDVEARKIKVPLSRCKNITAAAERKIIGALKLELAHYIEGFAQDTAAAMGVKVQSTQVKDYKRRWGSCDRRANLTFNWRLVFAPQSIINYVVIHELAHIKVFNHSRKFWTLVAQHYPDYALAKKWFHSNGSELYRFARKE